LAAKLPARGIQARIKGPAEKITAQFSELLPGHPIKILESDGDTALYSFGLGDKNNSYFGDAIAQLVVKNGWELHELRNEKATLEDVFCKLTVSDRLEGQNA